jgi:hypothetical protein
LCVFCMRFFCFYIVSSETASRPKKRLMRTYHWISLFMSYKASKIAYRIWVILIANERVKEKYLTHPHRWKHAVWPREKRQKKKRQWNRILQAYKNKISYTLENGQVGRNIVKQWKPTQWSCTQTETKPAIRWFWRWCRAFGSAGFLDFVLPPGILNTRKQNSYYFQLYYSPTLRMRQVIFYCIFCCISWTQPGVRCLHSCCYMTWVVQWLRLALSKGSNRVGLSLPHLKTQHIQFPKRPEF